MEGGSFHISGAIIFIGRKIKIITSIQSVTGEVFFLGIGLLMGQ